MEKLEYIIRSESIILRSISREDIGPYYKAGFEDMDQEMAYYTGTYGDFNLDGIGVYVDTIIQDVERYDFLILDLDGNILGESVINEIDLEARTGHFRISIFKSENFARGIGTEASKMTLQFAMEFLKLHRLELEVYGYNQRGYKTYEKIGFKKEGIKRDGAFLNSSYEDIVIMGLLEEDYKKTYYLIEGL